MTYLYGTLLYFWTLLNLILEIQTMVRVQHIEEKAGTRFGSIDTVK
jgi:hypothetical protein